MKESAVKVLLRNRPCYRWRCYSLNNRPHRRPAGSSRDCCRRQGILFVGGEPKVGKKSAGSQPGPGAGRRQRPRRFPHTRGASCWSASSNYLRRSLFPRLAAMRRSVGAAADQNACWWTRARSAICSARRRD